jgi:3-phenylpropionate/cinnamic acid dioxygenase small subunit
MSVVGDGDGTLRELLDEAAIRSVLHRYATALDDRDWDLLRTCFAEDVVAVYDSIGVQRGYAAIEALCRQALEPLAATQHLIGNVEVDLGGDEAGARCYLQATHVRSRPGGDDNFVVAGTYLDRLERRSGEWRIVRRELRRSWTAGPLHEIRVGEPEA